MVPAHEIPDGPGGSPKCAPGDAVAATVTCLELNQSSHGPVVRGIQDSPAKDGIDVSQALIDCGFAGVGTFCRCEDVIELSAAHLYEREKAL